MSVYSGKCDVYDHFATVVDDDNEENLAKEIERTDFYICGKHMFSRHRLDIHTPKDLIPYYPYLICIGSWGKNDRAHLEISSESFVDREEKEFIQWRIDDILKYYRKCKRTKKEFDKEEAYKLCAWHDEEWIYNLIDKIVENNFKYDAESAVYDGIFIPSFDNYRKSLAEKMIEAGYSEFDALTWCYGRRGFNKIMKDLKESTDK